MSPMQHTVAILSRLHPWPAIKRWWRAHLWAQALLIQLVSLLSVVVLQTISATIVERFAPFPYADWLMSGLLPDLWPGLWPALCLALWPALLLGLHLLLVHVCSGWAGMPVWWRWIQVLFPLAVIGMQALSMSPSVYLAGFLLCCAMYGRVHLTRVPFYPSFPATWRALVAHAEQQAGVRGLTVLEIGSGLGDTAFYWAQQRPQDHLTGIEIAYLPWLMSAMRARWGKKNVACLRGDYRQFDFAQADIVYAYLSPAVMSAVYAKARAEMRPGSQLISSEFAVAGIQPQQTLQPAAHAPTLYIYRF